MEVDGEVSFNLEVPSQSDQAQEARAAPGTAGPRLECSYQHPEQAQIDALLSNMMNALTKVFVRAYDFTLEDGQRRPETRFRVVDAKKTQFFEHIYHNMTHEFRQLYNSTAERVDRSGRDPCLHQEELKQTWRDLLDHSLATFRRAALRCVEERLGLRETGDDGLQNTADGTFGETSDDRAQDIGHERVWKIRDELVREIFNDRVSETSDKVWETSDDSVRNTGHNRIIEIGDDGVQKIRDNSVQNSSEDRVRETGGGRVREASDYRVWGTGGDRLRESKERTRSRLGRFLMRELAKIRTTQLNMLCENFQLCYNDLL